MLEEAQEEPALPKDLKHIPYRYVRLPEKESLSRASEFYQMAAARRTLRYFSADPVPKEVIREIIRAAGILQCDISVSQIIFPSKLSDTVLFNTPFKIYCAKHFNEKKKDKVVYKIFSVIILFSEKKK